MGHQCCIPGCNTNGRHGSRTGVTFHSFPVDPAERKQWLESLKKIDLLKLVVTKHTKVCSKHFRIEDFVAQHITKRRLLKKGVFPSIFTSVNAKPQPSNEGKEANVPSAESSKEGTTSSALPVHEDASVPDEQKDGSNTSGIEQYNSKMLDSQEFASRIHMDESAAIEEDMKGEVSCDFPGKSEDYDPGNMSDTTHTSSPSDSNMGSSCKKPGSGLSFHIGSRLEAKDLGNEIWYPVKVVEVDWEDEEVLIHFEKWSQRYDEWVPMDSSRLRPSQNPVPQNEGKSAAKVFKVGDKVMATWSDSRRYPAKVNAVLENDKYEVLFFDGYTKTIKGGRMTKIEDSDAKVKVETEAPKAEIPAAAKEESKRLFTSHPTFTKEERRERKRKINVVELFHPKKRMRLGNETPSRSEPEEEKPKEVQKRRRRKQSLSKLNDVEERSNESPSVPVDSKDNKNEPVSAKETSNAEDTRKKEKDVRRWKMKVKARVRRGDFASKLRRGVSLKQEEDLSGSKPLENNSNTKKTLNKTPNLEQETPSSPAKSRRESNDSTMLEQSGQMDAGEPDGQKKETSDSSTKKEQKADVCSEPTEGVDKWVGDGDSFAVESTEGDKKTIIVPDSNLPAGWSKHTVQRKHGSSAGKWDVILVNAEGRKFRTRHDIKQYFEEKGESYNPDLFDFCVSGKKRLNRAPDFSSRKVSRLGGSRGRPVVESGKEPVEKPPQQVLRRVKTLLPKIRSNSSHTSTEETSGSKSEPLSPPPPYTTTVAMPTCTNLETTELEGQVIVGGLKIQMENNTFKCPKGGCSKNFRKENLLQMHIKHYHPEYNKFMGSTPNVADLAYARTIGESIEDLMPKPRFSSGNSTSVTTAPLTEKVNRMDSSRKSKVASGTSGSSSNSNSNINTGDTTFAGDKKKPEPKDKQPGVVTTKKPVKRSFHENENRMLGEENLVSNEEPLEEKVSTNDTKESSVAPPSPEMPVLHKEEKKESHTIKILMPVIRSPPQETSLAERTKMKTVPVAEEGEEYIEVIDVGPRQSTTSHSTTPAVPAGVQLPTTAATITAPAVTKSLRAVKKRHLSDFHFEPIQKRRKIATKLDMSDEVDVLDDGETPADATSTPLVPATTTKTTPTTYRYSKKKNPIVHLEKLNIVTDSNGRVILSSMRVQGQRKLNKNSEQHGSEQLRKEELINCTCGFMEEDGLMIQCDLCLCWQHGICNNIEKETEVPEKYVCPICLNPYRQRKSKKYLHDQDWFKEGKLPSLSFRSKNEATIAEREAILKRSHDLTGSLLQIQEVLHSLRVKVNIAGIPDHPKLYLWAKSWEKDNDTTSAQLPGTTENEDVPSCSRSGSEKQKMLAMENCRPETCSIQTKSEAECINTKLIAKENKDNGLMTPLLSTLESIKNEKETKENKNINALQNISDVQNSFVVTNAKEAKNNVTISCQEYASERSDSSLSEKDRDTELQNASEIIQQKADKKNSAELSLHPEIKDDPNVCLLESPGKISDDKVKMAAMKCNEEITVAMEEVVLAQEEECIVSEEAVQLADDCSEQSVQYNETLEPEHTKIPENVSSADKKYTESEEFTEEIQRSLKDLTSSTEKYDGKKEEQDKLQKEENKVDKQEKTNKEHDLSGSTENHGLLHQALTNGGQLTGTLTNGVTGNNLDSSSNHSMLQLPICQSELMQFASTMADNLNVTDSSRPPNDEPPRVPQPEAPIDPVECRLCLLDHIDHFQTQIDTRLTMLEEQVAALESQDPDAATDEAPDFFPQTKQTVQMLLRDLLTMRRIAALN